MNNAHALLLQLHLPNSMEAGVLDWVWEDLEKQYGPLPPELRRYARPATAAELVFLVKEYRAALNPVDVRTFVAEHVKNKLLVEVGISGSNSPLSDGVGVRSPKG